MPGVSTGYQRAQAYITQYQAFTFKIQNPDGSFSTEWFNGRGNQANLDRKLQTTGHILEWLVSSLSPDELLDPRTMRAADFLSGILIDGSDRKWPIGPLGHALHALVMYDARLSSPQQPAEPSAAA